MVIAHGRPGQHHGGQGHVRGVEGGLARAGRLRLAHIIGGQGAVRIGQGSEIAVDPAVQLTLVKIARDDQIGIVRAIVGGVEAAHVLDGRGVEVLDRADGRAAVGMVLIDGRRHEQAEQPAIGAGQNALAVLLLDHVALALEHGFIDHQRPQPVGLGEDQPLKVIGRHGLVIGRDVVRGEGIVVAAHILGQPVEGLVREILGRLEHQMFEQVGEARAVLRIVLGSDPVPDLYGDVRGRGVARGEDPQPVRQGPLLEAERRHNDRPGLYLCGRRGVCRSPGVGRSGVDRRIGIGRRGAGGNTQHQGGDRGGGEQAGLHGAGLRIARQMRAHEPYQGRNPAHLTES